MIMALTNAASCRVQGCVAESPLFREKRDWFRFLFPLFQKYITKQYVPVSEAGRRVAAVVSDVSQPRTLGRASRGCARLGPAV